MSDPYTQRDIARRLEQTQVAERPLSGAGTALPGSPATGARFWRTDLGLECYYDGTRWLTSEQFQCDLASYTRNALPFAGAGSTTVLIAPQRTDYATYYVRAKVYIDILVTNNSTNFWTFALTLGATTVWTADTHLDAAGAINKEDSTAAVAATAGIAVVNVTKTLNPSNIFIACSYWYRLIIT